jgi:saccharopine dehydrogenase (NAD+, L-lysine-forming)
VLNGTWRQAGVFNVEQLDPSPFMDTLGSWGLPWQETFDAIIPDGPTAKRS